ncbi:MAG: DUF1684 domain-containing protein [Microbacterium sp.]|uniref:DUF1684 domain-containing protein n=1 Tax=Microbacterium sp. TaxID=51671 RepID=UPI001D1C722B|nr:DUF1684 domain-containing protein [Microbacterium sp.]MBW8763317.1 DUF1684 domain-containing protein [Microbacterium sp.]
MTLQAEVETHDDFAQEWEAWHQTHEKKRADPHGFLAVTGLFWLTDEPTRVPGLPGLWSTGVDGPVVELGPGEALRFGETPISGTHRFGPIAERDGITVGFDEGVIEIAKRGGRDILRPRRADFPFLRSYDGTSVFTADPKWRIPARFVRFIVPRAIEVGAAVDSLAHVYDSPGYVEFEVDGETFRLLAFPGHAAGSLFVLFTDATSGVTTYKANRTVTIEVSDESDETVIDFNRAVNLPCAYTDFATCPLPPAENHLRIEVAAGEKTPTARVEGVFSDAGIVPAASPTI